MDSELIPDKQEMKLKSIPAQTGNGTMKIVKSICLKRKDMQILFKYFSQFHLLFGLEVKSIPEQAGNGTLKMYTNYRIFQDIQKERDIISKTENRRTKKTKNRCKKLKIRAAHTKISYQLTKMTGSQDTHYAPC